MSSCRACTSQATKSGRSSYFGRTIGKNGSQPEILTPRALCCSFTRPTKSLRPQSSLVRYTKPVDGGLFCNSPGRETCSTRHSLVNCGADYRAPYYRRCLVAAIQRHSTITLIGHSDVAPTQQTAVQLAAQLKTVRRGAIVTTLGGD